MKTNISKLKSTLESIGKCVFNLDESIRDYKYNGKEINNVGKDFYLKLRNDFDEAIALQIVSKKIDENLLKKLIEKTQEHFYKVKEEKQTLRVSYLFRKSKNELRESSDWTHNAITAVMESQLTTLNKLNTFLIKLFEEYKYFVDDDFKKLKIDYSITDGSESIDFPEIGKINVLLTKKDTISLFLMLENIGILDFSDTNRNKIIEQNFNYKHSDGKIRPLKDINSDISNLKDVKTYEARNKGSFSKLNNKLIKLLESFNYKALALKLK